MRHQIIAVASIIAGAAIFPAYGGELDELKAVVRQLQQRIEQLENRQKTDASQAGARASAAQASAPARTAALAGAVRRPASVAVEPAFWFWLFHPVRDRKR